MNAIDYLNRESKPVLVTWGFVLIALLGIIDYQTGIQISFSIFYLLPVSLVTWFVNRRAGVFAAVTSAFTWLVADLMGAAVYSNLLTPYWNAAVRLGFFLIVVFLLSSLRQFRDNLEKMVEERTAALKSEMAGRERSEQLTLESEIRMRSIVETAIDGIITLDEAGAIQTFNPAAQRLFGYQADEVIGWPINFLIPDLFAAGQGKDAGRLVPRKAGQREMAGRRKDRTRFPVDLALSEVRLGEDRIYTAIIRDISESRRLQREILAISNREQQRIGQNLHDGLCQELTGIGFKSKVLEQKLQAESPGLADGAREIGELVNQTLVHTRDLARELFAVELEANGLMAALEDLARHQEKSYGVSCSFNSAGPVLVHDNEAATHLYRIAQEAVNNAIKHSSAKHIWIELDHQRDKVTLTVKDDGVGFPTELKSPSGLGLHIMGYRARMIGASLSIQGQPGAGTTVTCTFPENRV